jgi:AcrR family transcriptional regulator
MPDSNTSDRRTAIADAAVRILARKGARALTHRAVDNELGLAHGSTGNYFPTRSALLTACGARLAEIDLADAVAFTPNLDGPLSGRDVGELIADFLVSWLQPELRERQLARLELLLEATRSDELASQSFEVREKFISIVSTVLTAAGSTSPRDAARAVVAAFDGFMFDQLLYPRTAIDPEHVADQLTAIVAAWLRR